MKCTRVTDLYTLDANILFYAVDTDAGSKHKLALSLLRRTRTSDCIMTLQAMGELYNAVSRRRPQHREAAERLLMFLEGYLPVVSANFVI